MPSTLTYHSRVLSMSVVCSRKCSRWLSGMAGSLGLLQPDQLHEAGELSVLRGDQRAEFRSWKKSRAHGVFLAAAGELRALHGPADGVLEHCDDPELPALRQRPAPPGL